MFFSSEIKQCLCCFRTFSSNMCCWLIGRICDLYFFFCCALLFARCNEFPAFQFGCLHCFLCWKSRHLISDVHAANLYFKDARNPSKFFHRTEITNQHYQKNNILSGFVFCAGEITDLLPVATQVDNVPWHKHFAASCRSLFQFFRLAEGYWNR